jgi:hypothetical protein
VVVVVVVVAAEERFDSVLEQVEKHREGEISEAASGSVVESKKDLPLHHTSGRLCSDRLPLELPL